jgi:hypothetical protein
MNGESKGQQVTPPTRAEQALFRCESGGKRVSCQHFPIAVFDEHIKSGCEEGYDLGGNGMPTS